MMRRLSAPSKLRERIRQLRIASRREFQQGGVRQLIARFFHWIRGERRFYHPPPLPYDKWLAHTRLTDDALHRQILEIGQYDYQPLIAFVPAGGTAPKTAWERTLHSFQAQTYRNWALYTIPGDIELPDDIELSQIESLDDAAYVVPFHPGDRAARHLLYEIVRQLNINPGTQILYWDTDIIDADDTIRYSPFFKPGTFSPEMMLSTNYLAPAALQVDLVRRVEGSILEDSDAVTFRCAAAADSIRHIPDVLYHHAQAPDSISEGYRQAVVEHLQSQGIRNARYRSIGDGIHRLTWDSAQNSVSIIIPNKDNPDCIRPCVDSILGSPVLPAGCEVIIVDNGSTDRSVIAYYKSLEADPCVSVIPYDESFNYSRANNIGAQAARGDLLLFLNNDILPLDDAWLPELMRWCDLPGIGVVGGLLLYPDHTVQHAGVVIGMSGIAGHMLQNVPDTGMTITGPTYWYRNCSAVTGACMLIRRSLFETIGGFDEAYQLVFSDVKICLQAQQKGFRVVCTPFARLYHYEGKSRGSSVPVDDMERAFQDMKSIIEQGDPFYNPNLSRFSTVPALTIDDVSISLHYLQWTLKVMGIDVSH
ncbi:MAG: glycosyltransferase family 2 protein [Anaerolineae bacterium]|nr:glycosyltransferase family 2 protein [Anaerolineae bacterium]